MASITVRVRPGLVERLRTTTLLLFAATAEALHLTLGALERDPGANDEVRGHFARLAATAALLDQLGWTPGATSGDLVVTACPDLLHDAVLGSLLEAGETMAAALHEENEVEAEAGEVIALEALLKEVNRHR